MNSGVFSGLNRPRLCENAAVVPVVRKATSQIESGSTIEVQGMVGLRTKTRPSHGYTQPRPIAVAGHGQQLALNSCA